MIAFAAVDLRQGRVVQLVGGRPDEERISLPDAAAVTRDWIECGFRALHVVDLDAALGTGENRDAISAVIRAAAGAALVQVGGGVRSLDDIADLLDAGADRVVVGTRAVEDRAWLEQAAQRHPGRIVVAADVRGDEIVVRGWTAAAAHEPAAFLATLADIPLGAVLVTDVGREGRLSGIDVERFARLVRSCAHPLIASGGVAAAGDLVRLREIGAAGAVLGMSLYTGALDARAVAAEYAA